MSVTLDRLMSNMHKNKRFFSVESGGMGHTYKPRESFDDLLLKLKKMIVILDQLEEKLDASLNECSACPEVDEATIARNQMISDAEDYSNWVLWVNWNTKSDYYKSLFSPPPRGDNSERCRLALDNLLQAGKYKENFGPPRVKNLFAETQKKIDEAREITVIVNGVRRKMRDGKIQRT